MWIFICNREVNLIFSPKLYLARTYFENVNFIISCRLPNYKFALGTLFPNKLILTLGKKPTKRLSVFHHFEWLALKALNKTKY